MEPPSSIYRCAFIEGAEEAFTADHEKIVHGMRVYTNNLDRGTVDLSRARWEWNGNESKYHLWFDVKVDTTWRDEATDHLVQQSDDRVTTRWQGKAA